MAKRAEQKVSFIELQMVFFQSDRTITTDRATATLTEDREHQV